MVVVDGIVMVLENIIVGMDLIVTFPDGVQWAAPVIGLSRRNSSDSRMIFGPFNISAEALLHWSFLNNMLLEIWPQM